MADNKKYYYLKLKDNFFDSDEMIVLESMADGYLYSNILLKLYLRSLKYEGRLMFNERIPFNSQMLATITRHPVGVIEKAISIFRELKIIDVLDNGAIYMLDIQNFIGKSSTEADRQRAYQSKISREKGDVRNLTDNLTEGSKKSNRKSTPEIELEKETEKEKEIDLDLEKDKEKEGSCLPQNQVQNLADFIQNEFGTITPGQTEELRKLLFEDRFNIDVIKLAVTEASLSNKRSINYVKGILRNWKAEGIETVKAAEQRKSEKFAQPKAPNMDFTIPMDGPWNGK